MLIRANMVRIGPRRNRGAAPLFHPDVVMATPTGERLVVRTLLSDGGSG